MKFPNFFKKHTEAEDFDLDNPDSEDREGHEEVGVGTKVKVVSALSVVTLAMFVAYWVQEPDKAPSEVLSATNTRTEEAAPEIPAETLENLVAATETIPSTFEVDIVDFAYSPANIEVEPGTTVNWTNMDQVAHTVTGEEFSSSSLKAGESFTYTFENPGIYEYYCAFHPQMIGTITVSGTAIPATTEEDTTTDADTAITADTTTDASLDETAFDAAAISDAEAIDALNAAASDSLLDDNYAAPTDVVTMDANQMVNSEEAARVTPDELATTGPEDILYLALAALIMFINRRKLTEAFKK